MELRDYLEIGAKKAGSLTALGKLLDMSQPTISGVKAHKRALTIEGAVKLADYIGADLRSVIAANELVTEKKEERRNSWRPFVEHARAASYVIAVISAFVTLIVTPSPAEASIGKLSTPNALYYVKSKCYRHLFTRVISAAMNKLSTFVPRFCFSG